MSNTKSTFVFDGDFRQRPIQSYGSKQLNVKEELMQKVALERQQRENSKRQFQSAITIQACFRSFLIRKRLKNVERISFDSLMATQISKLTVKTIDRDVELIRSLLRKFLLFFDLTHDLYRMISLCQFILRMKEYFISCLVKYEDVELHQIKKLLHLCCKVIISNASNSSINITMPLRIIEVFLDSKLYSMSENHNNHLVLLHIAEHLIRNDYIKTLRVLLVHKVPDSIVYDENLLAPVTPMSNVILSLIKQLLYLAEQSSIEIRNLILLNICKDLFNGPASCPQIHNYLLPMLANTDSSIFSYSHFLTTLLDYFKYTNSISSNVNPISNSEKKEFPVNSLIISSDSKKNFKSKGNPIPNTNILSIKEKNIFYLNTKIDESSANLDYISSVVNFTSCSPFLSSSDLVMRSCHMEPSIYLLHAILLFGEKYLVNSSEQDYVNFLLVVQQFVTLLQPMENNRFLRERDGYHLDTENVDAIDTDDSDIDGENYSDEKSMEVDDINTPEKYDMRKICIKLLCCTNFSKTLLKISQRRESLLPLSLICHTLMVDNRLALHKLKLLSNLAFNPGFLRKIWSECEFVSSTSAIGISSKLLIQLSRGIKMSREDFECILPLLSVFSAMFSNYLQTLSDLEFQSHETNKNLMPFSLNEVFNVGLSLRDCCLGIVELTHPENRGTTLDPTNRSAEWLESRQFQRSLFRVFQNILKLVKQLYERDCRLRYCQFGFWLSNLKINSTDKFFTSATSPASQYVGRPFGTLSILNIKKEEDMPLLSTNDVRKLIILSELPFVTPFEERVKIFQILINQDKQNLSYDPFQQTPINIRRNYIYEDAYGKLSLENEPNLKKKLKISLTNNMGLLEAGVDGGGLFREFMNELVKTAFDPNRGFFKSTSDKLLYPNPDSIQIDPDNHLKHFYFLGRILGKVIYDNMLVELPFASFFLSKLLSRLKGELDIHHLASLDPDLHKNLFLVKNSIEDVSNLDLDFSVPNDAFGVVKTIDLKENGRKITVDNLNKIEYIHLMADYWLNKQIKLQSTHFREGLANVINIEWLRMFDHNELQILISGAQIPIDINDLRRNTNYSNGYTDDHPVIEKFWKVVEDFSDKQKQTFLKFVTSCSKPPLLGFKELHPHFAIQNSGKDTERLPTSSTCMNLLKLPEFTDIKTIRSKLLTAIESGAGFELS